MKFPNTGQPDRDWWSALWPDPTAVLRRLGLDSGTLVALACGDGYFAVPAARLADRIVGVDIDPDLLSACRRHAAEAGVAVETIAGDARDLSAFLAEPVDAVLLANTFHGVENRVALARGVREALRPGGRFVVVNWHARPRAETTVLGEARGPPTDRRMTPAETRGAVEPAGFRVVEEVELEPYHYAVAFERIR